MFDPPSLTYLRRRVEAMLPRIDLPELVLEVMSWHPGLTEAFTHAPETAPGSPISGCRSQRCCARTR
ncbi:hypothetical protein AB0M34_00380 [Nocardia sp. NPDC050193]